MTTPADRYTAFRDRQADPELAGFRALYDFDFDDFQVEACQCAQRGPRRARGRAHRLG